MFEQFFPTFSRWFASRDPHGQRRGLPVNAQWFRQRGPAWRVSTWWPGEPRRVKQHSLLHILSVAHRERLELAPLIDNLAAEHRGSYRRGLRRLARRLAAGASLIDALEQTPDMLSDSAVLAIRFGTQSGTLSSTYQQLLQARPFDLAHQETSLRHVFVYWLIPTVTLIAVMFFVMNVVSPIFLKISDEFGIMGLAMPAAFVGLHDFSQVVSRYGWLWLALGVMLAWLVLGSAPRRFFRRAIAARLFRPVAQLRSIELFRLLATAVDAGRPLPGAISTLARYHFDKHVRLKLLYARNEIEQGVDIWTGLADARLLTADESEALQRASSNEVRSWMLQQLANWKLALLQRRTSTWLTFLHPALVLLFAGIVLLMCFAIFGFLTYLITSLS